MFSAPDPKQRLRPSDTAWAVIHNDMDAFRASSKPGFLNDIFHRYYETAAASIGLRLSCRREELRGEGIQNSVIDKLIDAEESLWRKSRPYYEKGAEISFSISTANMDYLADECCEDEYYDDNRGAYFKAVIEEYARLPYVQRERVYLNEKCHTILSAVRDKRQLVVVTDKDKTYYVCPHPLEPVRLNPESTYNYLVGYCRNDPEEDWRPCSFRLTALQKLKSGSRQGYPSKERWKELDDLIRIRGVQFLAYPETTVRLRLTDRGAYHYKRHLSLRPTALQPITGAGEYTFCCTEEQARYYFFKMADEVEILAPLSLRERLAGTFQRGADIYKKSEEISDEF